MSSKHQLDLTNIYTMMIVQKDMLYVAKEGCDSIYELS
jgi:hypothetical protein